MCARGGRLRGILSSMHRLRTLSAFVVCALACASAARADVIRPFSGDCPPGLERRIGDHREICVARACRNNAACGRGAACRPLAECMEPQQMEGRAGPYTRDVRVALCGRNGACPTGSRCRRSRQCEPTAPSPGWDRRTRTWTGEAHAAVGSDAAPGYALGGFAGFSGLALVFYAARRRGRREQRLP